MDAVTQMECDRCIEHKWQTASPKQYHLEALCLECTIGVLQISQPEKTGVISVQLVHLNMEKYFLDVSCEPIHMKVKAK